MALSFAELVTSNIAQLEKTAYFLTQNKNNADDLFQETMIKIFSNENRFSLDSNFKAWSQTIMRNTFINTHRGMRKATFYVDASEMQNGLYERNSTSNDGEKNINYENLMNIIESLDERKRSVFLTYSQGYSYEEMAVTYQLNVQNLRSIVFCARKELQIKLSKNLK
jgi:RNA polymerase sigma-70 factor, ECF subfamily